MNKIKSKNRIRIQKRVNFRIKMINSSTKYQKSRKSTNKIKMKKWRTKIVRAFKISCKSNKIWITKVSTNIKMTKTSNTWMNKISIWISKTCGISFSNSPSKNPKIKKMFKPKNNQKFLNKKCKRHLKNKNFPINSNKNALVCLAT